jgi:putative cardiolipin synthase
VRRSPRLQRLLILVLLLPAWGCATLPDNSGKPVSYALTDTQDTRLAALSDALGSDASTTSGFYLLDSGIDAFVARAVLALAAERSIDAQYYLFHDDMTGALLLHQLVKAADRGVRVRLLVDDMAMGGREIGAAILDAHPNMAVRFINPFSRNVGRWSQFVTRFGSVTRRMHNKSFTVDNQATIVGGRNIGDEYFEANPDLMFGDLDVLAAGPVVGEVSASFDSYWNSPLAYPAGLLAKQMPTPEETDAAWAAFNARIDGYADTPYIKALKNSDLANRLRENRFDLSPGEAVVVSDSPEKLTEDRSQAQYHLAPQLAPFFQDIDNELIIFSPYFVPGEEGTAFFTDLVARGIRVRILTNSLASNDVGLVHAGYDRYRRDLLRGGVELYELNKKISKEEKQQKKHPHGSSTASLHAKSFVFDRQLVFIGSLNLDPRSFVENTEIGVVIQSKAIAERMARGFDEEIDQVAFRLELVRNARGGEDIRWHGLVDGAPATFDVDPYTSGWQRFGIALMGLLPIESQL